MLATKRSAILAAVALAASFGIIAAAGCGKKEEPAATPQMGTGDMMRGGPGMMGGGPGMMGGRGRRGGRGGMGGGPVAADATGDQIVQQKCGCHGPGGRGGNAPALSKFASRSEGDLAKIVHDGKGRMPAFGAQLSDEQIKKVVTWLKGLSG